MPYDHLLSSGERAICLQYMLEMVYPKCKAEYDTLHAQTVKPILKPTGMQFRMSGGWAPTRQP